MNSKALSEDKNMKIENEMKQSELEARALIAGDLFQEGEITRTECFRLEVDAVLGRDSGPIQFEQNQDYELNEM